MTAADFRSWLERRGWTYADAAPHFGVDPSTVWRWMNGKSGVPGPVAKLVELMDQSEAPVL